MLVTKAKCLCLGLFGISKMHSPKQVEQKRRKYICSDCRIDRSHDCILDRFLLAEPKAIAGYAISLLFGVIFVEGSRKELTRWPNRLCLCMSMGIWAFLVEDFGFQQDLSVDGTHIKLINIVSVAASGEDHILDVLRHVKREAANADESVSNGYLMILGLSANCIVGYLVRYYLPMFSLCYFFKVLGCFFLKLDH